MVLLLSLCACLDRGGPLSETESETASERGPCGAAPSYAEDRLGPKGYIEYKAGTLPLVLAVPHGGDQEPEDFPVVAEGLSSDGGSLELTLLLREALIARTGQAPHVVINHVRRNRLNLNTLEWQDEPNAEAPGAIEAAALWDEMIQDASAQVTQDCGFGAFLDMHTKAAEVNVGIGMGVSSSLLLGPSEDLNQAAVWEASSVRALAGRVADPIAAIRGPLSLGGLLSSPDYRVIPSPEDPGPGEEELYYYSGHNVWVHGSRDGGQVDGYHLEMHWEYINTGETNRQAMAEALADAMVPWMQAWYSLESSD